jgi:NDP-hexose 5-epimerase
VEIAEMMIPDAFRVVPERVSDRRGCVYEFCRQETLNAVVGRPFVVRQVNYSVSCRDTVRGIHATVTPPGEAKLVTCVRGAILDAVVDLRVGSPTFGKFELTHIDSMSGIGIYLAEGLGHGFLALTDNTCVSYLCSAEYVPGRMIDVQAFDPEIAIPWGLSRPPIMSDKDAAAPTLREVTEAGQLAHYDECRKLYAELAAGADQNHSILRKDDRREGAHDRFEVQG